MSFLKDLACYNRVNLNTLERKVALVIFEKLRFQCIDMQHPVHVIRNPDDFKEMEVALAATVLEAECSKFMGGIIISVFKKLVGDDPW